MAMCANGHENPDGQRFCGECGNPLVPATDDRSERPTEGGFGDGNDRGAATESADTRADAAVDGGTRSGRKRLVLACVVIAVVGAGVGAWLFFVGGEDTEGDYLAVLADSELNDEFSTDRAAVRNAERLCEDIYDGGDPTGSEADRVGVEFYCPEYLEDFQVLEVIEVEGTFTIVDSESAGSGSTCEGEGGYGDINASTQVVVRNNAGEVLARTELGLGEPNRVTCTFEFSFDLVEGEGTYVVEVGDRGEISYSFDELKQRDLSLSIG